MSKLDLSDSGFVITGTGVNSYFGSRSSQRVKDIPAYDLVTYIVVPVVGVSSYLDSFLNSSDCVGK